MINGELLHEVKEGPPMEAAMRAMHESVAQGGQAYQYRQRFLFILSPFRSTDLFVGVSVWQVLALQQNNRGARRLLFDGLSLLLL